MSPVAALQDGVVTIGHGGGMWIRSGARRKTD